MNRNWIVIGAHWVNLSLVRHVCFYKGKGEDADAWDFFYDDDEFPTRYPVPKHDRMRMIRLLNGLCLEDTWEDPELAED